MSAAWLPGNLLTFDTETTAANPEEARIVTASVIEVGAEGVVRREKWLVNPGIPIPAEATAIHGITNEMAEGGIALSTASVQVANALLGAWGRGLPVVIMNAHYDLEVLQNCLTPLDRLETIGPILDPLVIDRAMDPYRKGKRTLTALAAHYGVRLDGAHSSDGDALAAARVVWKQARLYWALQRHTLAEMQEYQRNAHAVWAAGFEAYLRKQGKPAVIEMHWPVRSVA